MLAAIGNLLDYNLLMRKFEHNNTNPMHCIPMHTALNWRPPWCKYKTALSNVGFAVLTNFD